MQTVRSKFFIVPNVCTPTAIGFLLYYVQRGTGADGSEKLAASVKHTILAAGMGTSPAALTETVWALAYQDESTMSLEDLLAAQKALMNEGCKGNM